MSGSVPQSGDESEWFARPVQSLARPWREELARRLTAVDGLDPEERDTLLEAGHTTLLRSLHAKLSRLFLIELHALRMAQGAVPDADRAGDDSDRRTWAAFIELAGEEGYLDKLAGRYPTVGTRIASVARLSVAATSAFAQRLAADRALLGPLLGRPAGRIRAVEFGAGDSHRGGLTVSRVDFADARVMYKPRPSQADVALGALLDELFADFPGAPAPEDRIRVPRTLVREGYGWAEFVHHRYCADDELAAFYRNMGHWLAVLRFCGGTDMHAENMIATGPVPVIVDAETLFDAPAPFPPSGRGDAVDVAARGGSGHPPHGAAHRAVAGTRHRLRPRWRGHLRCGGAARPAAADPESGDRGRRHRGRPLPGGPGGDAHRGQPSEPRPRSERVLGPDPRRLPGDDRASAPSRRRPVPAAVPLRGRPGAAHPAADTGVRRHRPDALAPGVAARRDGGRGAGPGHPAAQRRGAARRADGPRGHRRRDRGPPGRRCPDVRLHRGRDRRAEHGRGLAHRRLRAGGVGDPGRAGRRVPQRAFAALTGAGRRPLPARPAPGAAPPRPGSAAGAAAVRRSRTRRGRHGHLDQPRLHSRGVVDQGAARRPLHRAGRGGTDAGGVRCRGAGRTGGRGARRGRDLRGRAAGADQHRGLDADAVRRGVQRRRVSGVDVAGAAPGAR